MGTVWIPEVETLAAVGSSGTMLGGPPRAVWHTTEAPSGKTSAGRDYFDLMHRVLTGKQAEPSVLYDPLTDRLGQFFPLNRSARALRNDDVSGTSTNKTGTACIQIEVVGYASKPFTDYWRPGPNFLALMRAIRSWGIPDDWPGGRMSAAGEDVSRNLTTWKTRAGHYGHCHVPGNTHWDCGAINQQALFAAAGGTTTEDDDMTPDQAAQLARIENVVMRRANGGVQDIHNITSATLAEVRALRAVVVAMAGTQGLDGAAVLATVSQKVDEALSGLRITLSTEPDAAA